MAESPRTKREVCALCGRVFRSVLPAEDAQVRLCPHCALLPPPPEEPATGQDDPGGGEGDGPDEAQPA